jgi:prolyl oligopeptidase
MKHLSLRLIAAAVISLPLAPAMSQTPASAPNPSPVSASAAASAATATPTVTDPFLWLEDVQGERSLAWVRERNAESQRVLQAQPGFAASQASLLALLNAKYRIPYIARRGDWLYNFWQDEEHKRGLWRRTTLAEYRKPQPAWETVLDLDAVAAAEKENWVWGGSHCLGPDYRHCLIELSRGGADAKVVREFDSVDKRFVAGGFSLPEAKSTVEWVDADTVYVGTDFGPGSMTDSGYPRVIKRWKRGTPLSQATTVFEGETQDVAVGVSVDLTPGFERTVFDRAEDFYHNKRFLLVGTKLVELGVPTDASYSFWNNAGQDADRLLIELRSDLQVGDRTYARGSLLLTDSRAFLAGERRFAVLFEPTATRSLAGYTTTRSSVIVNVLDNVASRLEEWHRSADGTYAKRDIAAPFPGSLEISGMNDNERRNDPLGENYLVTYTGFLTPDSLLLGRSGSDDRELLKALPPAFDSTGMHVEQSFATSKDGTKVPYFIVWPKGADSKHPADGTTPTLLYGYGGFEVSQTPWYSRAWGNAWMSRGGALVIANIRGGGEFGPAWHQAAMKEHKQRSYDDFIAVAEDLIARKITSPRHLGIQGGSNGGLLMGAMLTQRPDLFNAVLCQVPLLDMKRYHKLLAGASWMAEYGNPDLPEEWAYISRYSPYQNMKPGVHYPRVFFTTSTRDDRVHPGHARKMTALMLSQGHEVLYYENIEGGHGGAADNEQRAHMQALEFGYLWLQLGR